MKLAADLHVHTVASGHAYSTIKELARAASKKEMEIIAITDHGPCLPGGPHPYYFNNLKVLPDNISGVRVLKGVEANITDRKGTLDLPVKRLARLDVVLTGFHRNTGYNPGTKEENTEVLVRAIKNPLVDIVVHPGNPTYDIEVERVIEAAQEEDTLLEVNNSSHHSRPGSKENCVKIARLIKEAGFPVVLGTDTHYADQVGDFTQALKIVKKAGLKKEDILNTSAAKVKEFISRKKKIKQKYG